jgi:hypothetical protein
MNPSWHMIRLYAKRLETRSRRVKDAIWTGDRRQLLNTLADIAETGEIARRLYSQLQQSINATSQDIPHAPEPAAPRNNLEKR